MARSDFVRIGFIGAGPAGAAVAIGLAGTGQTIAAVTSRRAESAERLAARIPDCRAVADPQAVVDAADLVFLAVADDAIAAVAAALRWRPDVAAVHLSGAHSVDVLAPVVQMGGQAGGFHPLQTFAGPDASLTGITIAIEAEEPLLGRLMSLAGALGGRAIRLRPGDKPLYHAAAVLVSNYVVGLVRLAVDLWGELDVPPDAATAALLPLLRGTVENLGRVGLPAALTGPIARGDLGTVRRHLAAIEAQHPAALDLYCALGRAVVPVALAKGGIDTERARELLADLTPSPLGPHPLAPFPRNG